MLALVAAARSRWLSSLRARLSANSTSFSSATHIIELLNNYSLCMYVCMYVCMYASLTSFCSVLFSADTFQTSIHLQNRRIHIHTYIHTYIIHTLQYIHTVQYIWIYLLSESSIVRKSGFEFPASVTACLRGLYTCMYVCM